MRQFLAVILAVALMCWGQAIKAAPNPSIRAVVDGIEDGEPDEDTPKLVISNLSVAVKLHGRMAEVTLDATITNPGDDDVEARFALALPQDAVVTGYALDVEGVLIDGVLVDQPKAKAVYEDEIRKGIDPGLAEVTRENAFKTRIYPIDSEGKRSIRVRFVAPVDLALGFVMPLETEGLVGTLKVAIEAAGLKAAPKLILPFDGKLNWVRKDGIWRATAENLRDRLLKGTLALGGLEPQGDMLVSRHANGRDYFQIAGFDAKRKARPLEVNRLRIYWDASLSRRDDLLAEERALMADLVRTAKPQMIDLVRFTSGKPDIATFTDSAALDAALATTLYRGGTSLAGLDDLKLADAELCVMFSDGQPTIDADASFRPGCKLALISSTPEANGVRLGRLARAARGQYLRLTSKNRAELAARLLKPGIAVVDARDSSGGRLPFRALTAPDGNWLVVGRMPDYGEVTLRIAGLGKGTSQRIYATASGGADRHNAAGALWAVDEVEAMAENPLKREAMRTLSRTHQVASPGMALLVLERPDQYLNADIDPPKGFNEEWVEEYRDGLKDRREEQASVRKERLEFVLEQWKERKTWWAKNFDPPKKVKRDRRPPEPVLGQVASEAAADAAGAAPGGAASRSEADEEEYTGDIVVTGAYRGGPTQSVPLAISVVDAEGREIEVKIADVLSNTPYLKALDAAAPDKRLAVLAEQEKTFGSLPAFYFDTAEWFRLKGEAATADALLLSALELPATDDETRLIVAFRLQRAGLHDDAVRILELLAVGSEFRPQPRRALAQALIARARQRPASGRPDLERAFKLLTEVAFDPAIGDFDGIETIALMEANAIIPRIEAAGGSWELDSRLVALLDTDVRILIEWTNDDADIDLWVIEPTGEKVFYSNKESKAGGLISNDMTDGYGPEEYAIRRAIEGEYRVRIDGYSSDRLNPNGKGRVMVRLIRDFARAQEREDMIDAEISFDVEEEDEEGGKAIASMKVMKK